MFAVDVSSRMSAGESVPRNGPDDEKALSLSLYLSLWTLYEDVVSCKESNAGDARSRNLYQKLARVSVNLHCVSKKCTNFETV